MFALDYSRLTGYGIAKIDAAVPSRAEGFNMAAEESA
jgi:hypothetical protein